MVLMVVDTRSSFWQGTPRNPGCNRPPKPGDVGFIHQPDDRTDRTSGACRGAWGVITLPKHSDEKVARLHLAKYDVNLTQLSDDQASYIGVESDGPYKPGTTATEFVGM